jgi:lysophospholipase L1-like esterase
MSVLDLEIYGAARKSDLVVNGYGSFAEFLLREGEPIQRFSNGSATPAAGAVNTQIAATAAIPLIGKTLYLQSVHASANQLCVAQIGIGGSADGRFLGFTGQFVTGPGQQIIIPVGMAYRGFQVETGVVGLNVRRMLSAAPGTDVIYGAVTANGNVITDDFNFAANKRVLFIGDSTLNGTGPTKTEKMWPFIVRNHLVDLGYDVRNILKSVSGSTTTDHELWRAGGYHDVADPALCVYSVGINDAGAAVSDATYTANLTAFWEWFSDRYSQGKMIVTGVTPLENNTSETRAAGLRAAASAYVTSVNSPRLKYINLGGAFDRTVSSNYAASDTPGSRVHPNDTGHAAVASTFITAFNALNLSL